MVRQVSFKAKLILLCILLSSVSALVGGVSYHALTQVNSEYTGITDVNLPNIRNSDQMFLAFRNYRIHLQTLATEDAPPELEAADMQKMKQDIAEYEKYDKAYEAIPFQVGEDELYQKVVVSWKENLALGDRIIVLNKSTAKEDHVAMMKIFFEEAPAKQAEFREAITALTDFHQKAADVKEATAQATAARATWMIFTIIFVGIFMGLLVGYFFSSSISKTLSKISEGLGQGAGTVTKVANEIAAAAEGLSAATTEQAAAIQETTAAVEETSAMVAKNAENAKISTDVSSQSQSTASKGQQAVDEMLQSIDEISQSNNEIMTQVEASNREISDIVKVISEIGNKTKVINDIVFQTKLLSFNASVEAARAGEHGKGFAVVAEEVGNLAQMSGNSAKEISEMLESSIKKVEDIVNNTKNRVGSLIQNGKQKVEAGTQTAKRCSEILEEIVANVSRVGSLVEEISTASSEQSRGITEINKAMSELDNVAQQNSAASQQAASSAEALKDQVLSVREMASKLNEIVTGAKSEGSTAPVAPVIPLSSAGKKAKVAAKKTTAPKKSSPPTGTYKQAAGFDVPSSDDPGFNE